MLSQALALLNGLDVEQASATLVECCGGVLQDVVERGGTGARRYKVSVPHS